MVSLPWLGARREHAKELLERQKVEGWVEDEIDVGSSRASPWWPMLRKGGACVAHSRSSRRTVNDPAVKDQTVKWVETQKWFAAGKCQAEKAALQQAPPDKRTRAFVVGECHLSRNTPRCGI